MKVYRFEKNDAKRLKTILNGEIYFSCPEYFNDLEDCRVQKIYPPDFDEHYYTKLKKCIEILYPEQSHNYFPLPDEILNSLKAYFCHSNPSERDPEIRTKSHLLRNKIVREIRDYIRKTTGVCCFFKEVPTHPLMWAHYADGHRGFCIEYEVDERENQLFDVNYITEPVLSSITELLLCPHEALMRIFTTKSMEWNYEKEVRLLYFDMFRNSESGTSIDLPTTMKPTKLITGDKFYNPKNSQLLETTQLIKDIELKFNIKSIIYTKFIYDQKNNL